MSKAKEAIARARRTASEARADAARMAAGGVTSYLIGSMEAAGTMSQVPQVFGLPRTVTLAVVGKLIEYNMGGTVAEVAGGAATAAANIAIYQFSRGQTVSGDVGAGNAIRDRGRRLESAAARALQPGAGLGAEEEIAALEGAAPPRNRERAHA